MRWILLAMVMVATAATVVGCGSKSDPGPTCAQITDHMLEVTKQELVGHGDELLGQRKTMIEQCEGRKLTADQRRCLVAAKDMAGFAACRAGKDPAPGPDEKPRRPRPPVGSGSAQQP